MTASFELTEKIEALEKECERREQIIFELQEELMFVKATVKTMFDKLEKLEYI